MHYEYREDGRYLSGKIRAKLYADGQFIDEGTPTYIDRLLITRIQPGDTYQEFYLQRKSDIQTYEQVMDDWQLLDDVV